MRIQYGNGNVIRNGLIGGRAILRLWNRVEEALFYAKRHGNLPTFGMDGEPCQPRGAHELLDCLYPIKDVFICFPPGELNLFARRELKAHLPDDLLPEYSFYFDEGRREQRSHQPAKRTKAQRRWAAAAVVAEDMLEENDNLTWDDIVRDPKFGKIWAGEVPPSVDHIIKVLSSEPYNIHTKKGRRT